ncbi:MAG: ABC-2 transporter permease [Pseudomonadales bacterium]
MSTDPRNPVIRELIRKDLTIMKVPFICYWLAGIGSIVVALTFGDTAGTVAFILFVSVLFGAGIHASMTTVTEERREQNLPFIMSLPITVRDWTVAKMSANLLLVGGIWLTLSAASYLIYIGDVMPHGTIPMMTMILVGIFLAYVIVLATAVVFQSITPAIVAIVGANLGTQAYLWWVSSFHGIRSTVNGMEAIWNGTALTVLGLQCAAIGLLIGLTFYAQSRKTEFL